MAAAHERISKYIVWMFCWQKKRAKLKERKLLCVSLSGLSPSVSNKQTLLLYTLVYIIVLCCFIHEHIERLKNCIYSYHSDISGGWNFFLIVLLLERIELITWKLADRMESFPSSVLHEQGHFQKRSFLFLIRPLVNQYNWQVTIFTHGLKNLLGTSSCVCHVSSCQQPIQLCCSLL